MRSYAYPPRRKPLTAALGLAFLSLISVSGTSASQIALPSVLTQNNE